MVRIKLNTKIKASSLFETIVALTVIMIVFGIALTVFVNIMRTGNTLSEFKTSQQLEVLAKETKENKSYFNETFEEEGIVITKSIEKYKDSDELIVLIIEATDKTGRKLSSRKEIILGEKE